MSGDPAGTARASGLTAVALAALGGAACWMFWPEVRWIAGAMVASSEGVHGLVALGAMGLLAAARRRQLAAVSLRGSPWGFVLIVAGLAVFAAGGFFPYKYGYARDVAIVPVLAGAVLATCGWGVLKWAGPMLLLALLAIPIPTRLYLSLTGPVQWAMLRAVSAVLGAVTGLETSIQGTDLVVTGQSVSGVLGVGGARWPGRLLLMFAVVGVFVAFSRKRSVGRIVWMALAAGPILLICDLLRLLCWSAVAIGGGMDPTSTLPQAVSMPVAMLAAYGLFAAAASIRLKLFTEEQAEEADAVSAPAPAAAPRAVRAFSLVAAALAMVVLVAAAVGLRPSMTALSDRYAKRTIDVRRSLTLFDPLELPSFRRGWEAIKRPLPLEELDTEECCWLDLKPVGSDKLTDMAGIALVYNSKVNDPVAHTPDVCIRQAGATVSDGPDVDVELSGVRPEYARVRCRSFRLRWPEFEQVVVFCFLAEGEFVGTRRAARRIINWPGHRHTYHSLIMADARYELDEPPDRAYERCRTLLRESLPILLNEYYPDPEIVRR